MKIAIASGKGGTGKTTLAVNLAVLTGTELPYDEVVLVDLDVEEPNSGHYFKRNPVFSKVITRDIPGWNPDQCTFCGHCREVCNFNAITLIPDQVLVFPELCHSCSACMDLCPGHALDPEKRKIGSLVHHDNGTISFVESKLEVGEPSGVELIRQTREYVRTRYNDSDYVIFDCPPGNSCPVIESVKGVDFVILVTEPTPFGLHDLKIALKTMQRLNLDHGVVINKSMSPDNLVKKHCKQNDVLVLGTIMHSRSYAEVISNGGLLVHRFPGFREALKGILVNVQNGLIPILTSPETE
jgi:MinD superfamily P-loop ATPase